MREFEGIFDFANNEYDKKEKKHIQGISKAKDKITTLKLEIKKAEKDLENHRAEMGRVTKKITKFCKECGDCKEKDAPGRTHWCASGSTVYSYKPKMKQLVIENNQLWSKEHDLINVLCENQKKLDRVEKELEADEFYLRELHFKGLSALY